MKKKSRQVFRLRCLTIIYLIYKLFKIMKKKCTREFFPPGSVSVILLRMKLLTFFVLVSMVTATASSYSQQTKFSLNLNGVTVKQVFQEIEANSKFVLLYKEKQLDSNRKVDVKVDNETVETILNQVFESTNNTYKIYDRQIVILAAETKISPSVIISTTSAEQKKEISGIVKDNRGLSLPGVSVVVKGTTTGIVTDTDGKFTLSVPALSLIHISEPTRLGMISYAVFCLK